MSSKGAVDTQTQSAAVAAGNTNFVPASGSLGSSSLSSFAGPWYVETQTLQVNYVRVPREQYWNNTCNATLSGLSTTHSNIQSTKLICNYVASYDAAVVYQTFNSSSVQQPQEFTVVAASGDPNGVSYGTLNASTLGPMGSIITSQPYIRRTAYTSATSATQPVISKTSVGSQFAIFDNVVSGNQFATMEDGTDYMTDINFWSQAGSPIGNASRRTAKPSESFGLYQIPGAYDTSKELIPLSTIVDAIGTQITNERMFAWPIPNQGSNFLPTKDEGLPEYDINRHA